MKRAEELKILIDRMRVCRYNKDNWNHEDAGGARNIEEA